MQREMESLFSRIDKKKYRFPAINLYDNNDQVIAEFFIPGMKKEELEITFENGTLIVKGDKKGEVDDEKFTLIREERNRGTFNRSVEIPVQINVSKITAKMENGILKISLPKAEEAKPKQIKIS
jgi:HSP20 family protein